MEILTHAYTGKYVVYTRKTAVYTVFSQPIECKLGTQTFNQHTPCQHNCVNNVWTVTVFCVNWSHESNESELSQIITMT